MQYNIQHYCPSFYTFYERHFFPGQTPVSPRSRTWILDLSHDPIWAIWLAEVGKFHQHHDRISNYTHYKVWDEITYRFPNFRVRGAAIESWEWISNFIPCLIRHVINYLSMLGLKFIHVCKRGPWWQAAVTRILDCMYYLFMFQNSMLD